MVGPLFSKLQIRVRFPILLCIMKIIQRQNWIVMQKWAISFYFHLFLLIFTYFYLFSLIFTYFCLVLKTLVSWVKTWAKAHYWIIVCFDDIYFVYYEILNSRCILSNVATKVQIIVAPKRYWYNLIQLFQYFALLLLLSYRVFIRQLWK